MSCHRSPVLFMDGSHLVVSNRAPVLTCGLLSLVARLSPVTGVHESGLPLFPLLLLLYAYLSTLVSALGEVTSSYRGPRAAVHCVD